MRPFTLILFILLIMMIFLNSCGSLCDDKCIAERYKFDREHNMVRY